MKIQNTEWGYIEWKHTYDENNPKQAMNIYIAVTMPGKKHFNHVHYGQEQMIYILEGEGLYIINGVWKPFSQGMIFYIESGSTHESINTGDRPIKELIVSNNVGNIGESEVIEINPNSDLKKTLINYSESTLNLYAAVESIRGQFIDPFKIPLIIYDDSWNIVLKNPYFPLFCFEKCNPMKFPKNCDCMNQKSSNQFVCKYGITIYNIPILYKNNSIGVIRGGYVLLSDLNIDTIHSNLYDIPEGAARSIKRLLKQISKNIINFCSFYDIRKDLQEKEQTIARTYHYGEQLEMNLKVAQDAVTNLRINHHFLFNTLNSMASIALDDGCYDLYSAIIDLSKMFRYTMRSDLRFVELEAEILYIKNYLNLQKLRYGEALKVEYVIPKDLYKISVPFNFIQPIVENAFTHGFRDIDKEKQIKIVASVDCQYVVIEICNNGTTLDESTIEKVKTGIRSNNGHGLSLIYTKFTSAYGSDFEMNIKSNSKEGTYIVIKIPIANE
nr:histidine kinase [Clostridioides difficile]